MSVERYLLTDEERDDVNAEGFRLNTMLTAQVKKVLWVQDEDAAKAKARAKPKKKGA